jgi:hypothetical protein
MGITDPLFYLIESTTNNFRDSKSNFIHLFVKGTDAIVTSVGGICKWNTVEGTIPKEGIGVVTVSPE